MMSKKTIKHTMNEVKIPAGGEVDVDVDGGCYSKTQIRGVEIWD